MKLLKKFKPLFLAGGLVVSSLFSYNFVYSQNNSQNTNPFEQTDIQPTRQGGGNRQLNRNNINRQTWQNRQNQQNSRNWQSSITRAQEPKVKVLTGRKVYDALTKEVLEYPQVIEINREELANLNPSANDQGITPDEYANDGFYSNFTIRSDVLGEKSFRLLERTLNSILLAEEMTPLEFQSIISDADPENPNLNVYKILEETRDNRVKVWQEKFLFYFRKDPKDPKSDFFALYIPKEPSFPTTNFPQGFDPRAEQDLTNSLNTQNQLEREIQGTNPYLERARNVER